MSKLIASLGMEGMGRWTLSDRSRELRHLVEGTVPALAIGQ